MKHLLLLLLPVAAVSAAEIELSIEIPRLEVAEYHRPYLAAWLEKPDSTTAADLTVWYDVQMKDKRGEQWLKDLRQWWRKSGRGKSLPIDGVTAPTRPVGKHPVKIKAIDLPALDKGQYTFVVEATREVGGREMVRIPFTWDGKTAVASKATGSTELGEINFSIQARP